MILNVLATAAVLYLTLVFIRSWMAKLAHWRTLYRIAGDDRPRLGSFMLYTAATTAFVLLALGAIWS